MCYVMTLLMLRCKSDYQKIVGDGQHQKERVRYPQHKRTEVSPAEEECDERLE